MALNVDNTLCILCMQCRLVRSGLGGETGSMWRGAQRWENRRWTGKAGFVEAVRWWGVLFSLPVLSLPQLV